jgi:hypothetical protein
LGVTGLTDDIINSVLFYFACASLDVFFTIVVICTGIGIEGNPIWNWITPKELMLVVCVLANLLFCLFMFAIIPYLKKRHPIYQTIVKFGLYGEGLGRLVVGVVPGIMLMKGAGWF